MEDIVLLDAVERYLNGEMNGQERMVFDDMRRQNPELDQLVVEHQLFLQQLGHYGQRRDFKHQLNMLHSELLETGAINEIEEAKKATVIDLWKKYKRTIAVAASIAGITALSITGIVHAVSPKVKESDLELLGAQITSVKNETNTLKNEVAGIKSVAGQVPPVEVDPGEQKSGGSGFLIDGQGYLVTNAHVVQIPKTDKLVSTLRVVNKERSYAASIVYIDQNNDIAILKIDDKNWKPVANLPYSLRKSAVDLGEEIFTLGYPRNSIVYNRGYLSAASGYGEGYKDDTLSVQIAIGANHGNSGGPVLDKNGDIIGILSTRDKSANEVVFALKASNINHALDQLKKDDAFKSVKLPAHSSLKGADRVQQIKKIQDCVFMVKGF